MTDRAVLERFDGVLEHGRLGEITMLSLRRGTPRRSIIHLHGSDAAKETDLLLAVALAEAGFRVVMPDAPWHGERAPVTRKPFLEAMGSVLETAAEETSRVRDWLIEEGATEVALSGRSFGGLRALRAATAVPSYARLSLLVTGGDFRTLLERSSMAALRTPETRQALSGATGSVAQGFDPLHYVGALAPMPVFLAGSVKDHVLPIECARSLAEALRGREDFHYIEYEDLGHALAPRMIHDLTRWHLARSHAS